MPLALAILVGCQLIGEVLREALHLPLPGPVIGMFLLAVGLTARGLAVEGDDGSVVSEATAPALNRTASALIANMGLLFVPAGVGVITEFGLLGQEWLPILVGLVVSTVLSLVVTGLVMHWVSRGVGVKRERTPALLGRYQVLVSHQEGR